MSLSETLEEYGKSVTAWLDQAKKATAATQRLQKAVAGGNLRDIEKRRSEAKEASERLSQLALECPAFQFNAQEYLDSDGAFVPELMRAAEQAGVRLYERDGVIFCYPVLVRAEPSVPAVRIDRKPEYNVRPEVLAALLKKAQGKEPKARPEQFIEQLFKVYELVVGQKKRYAHAGVPLTDLYKAPTLRPDKEYTLLDFTRDLYFLDSSGITETRAGERMSLIGPRAARERGALVFVTRDGYEKHYAYIKFTAAEGRG